MTVHPQGTLSPPTAAERFRSMRAVVLDYLIRNPIAGLRTSLRGAPLSTWVLVPLFSLVTLGLGLPTGLLTPEWSPWWLAIVLAPVLVVYPTLIEEFFYRGVLLPRSLLEASATRRFWAVTASTIVFVAAHPIGPLLGISRNDIFLEPVMLVIVAVLGYTTAYSYLRSGSLWAPMLIHWVAVVVWNLFFGGVY